MKWVIDASVAAKWLAPERDSPLAEALLDEDDRDPIPDGDGCDCGQEATQSGASCAAARACATAAWLRR